MAEPNEPLADFPASLAQFSVFASGKGWGKNGNPEKDSPDGTSICAFRMALSDAIAAQNEKSGSLMLVSGQFKQLKDKKDPTKGHDEGNKMRNYHKLSYANSPPPLRPPRAAL